MSFQVSHLNRTKQDVADCKKSHFMPKREEGAATRCYLAEALVTVWTLVALVSVVRLQVSHLGSGVREGLVAVVTLVRLLAAVHQLVAL